MQVARIHEHGGPEVLRLEEVERPSPGAGEVPVRVLGASVNHLDLWVRRGMPGFAVGFPRCAPRCAGHNRRNVNGGRTHHGRRRIKRRNLDGRTGARN